MIGSCSLASRKAPANILYQGAPSRLRGMARRRMVQARPTVTAGRQRQAVPEGIEAGPVQGMLADLIYSLWALESRHGLLRCATSRTAAACRFLPSPWRSAESHVHD
jgi:hypothetical protein